MKAIIAAICVLFCVISCSEAQIDASIASTIKIVSKLCQPFHHGPITAIRFFACYDGVTGRDHFIACQRQVFGSTPNTMLRIDMLCLKTQNGQTGWDAYNNCIVGEWKKAGLDINLLIQGGTHVNQCQARVVGVSK